MTLDMTPRTELPKRSLGISVHG